MSAMKTLGRSRDKTRALLSGLLVLGYLLTSWGFGIPLFRDSLDNGLIVLTYEDHRLPMVDISLVCRSGSGHDPIDKPGLANFTATMLTRGTTSMSADSVSSIVDFLGAQFYSNASSDQSEVTIRSLSKDFGTGLDLVADAALRPGFERVLV
ncbi:MAG: insulinase family protein, partial [candidate division WOR-3 bacterium]